MFKRVLQNPDPSPWYIQESYLEALEYCHILLTQNMAGKLALEICFIASDPLQACRHTSQEL